MSPSAFITKRRTTTGKLRYVVRYRLGGRGFKLIHAGSFRSLEDARTRRQFVIGELAAGRDPRATLKAIADVAEPRTYAEQADRLKQSRIDWEPDTVKSFETALKRLLPTFGHVDPHSITWSDCAAWVGEQAAELAPGTVEKYLTAHRQILDFAEVAPNPARDKRVKLPARVYQESSPPTAANVLAMLRLLAVDRLRPLVTIEQTGMALGEVEALSWGDVDVSGGRFRLRRATVKAGIRARARWVTVPSWLMELLEESCPLEDRVADRRVFPGFNGPSFRVAMGRACKTAKIPHYHPHDLRHRRISLWVGSGLSPVEAAARAGHTKSSMTLDVYSHVMPLDELDPRAVVTLIRDREASRREAQVRSHPVSHDESPANA